MSPATRRKRLRKTSTGSGSLANQSTSIERITDDGHHHQQQQQTSMDGINASNIHHIHQLETISSFSVTQGNMGSTGGAGNVRNIKSSPGSMQHQESHQDQHHLDDSTHLTEMVCILSFLWYKLNVYIWNFPENWGFVVCKSKHAIRHFIRNLIIAAGQLSTFTSSTHRYVWTLQLVSYN